MENNIKSSQMKKHFNEAIIHALIWAILYLLVILFTRNLGPFNRIDNTLIWPVTIGTLFNAIIFYSISMYLIPYYLERKQTGKFFTGLVSIFIVITVIETLLDHYYMVWVYSDSREPFYGMIIINGFIHFIFVSLALSYGFGRNWIVNERKKQQLSQEKLSAELNFLKSQLNPHFLFNVLNMAYSSASKSGDERTADIIEKLAGLMRYMLYESNVERVEMGKEISFIRTYIKLQKMRFSDDMPVKINFDLRGDYTSCHIAPLILISFIENAFKYGVKLEQESEINLSIHILEDELEFKINNKIFTHHNPLQINDNGIGIRNTRKRLELIYPNRHKLEIGIEKEKFNVGLWLKLN